MAERNCPSCGNQCAPTARFCVGCGARLGAPRPRTVQRVEREEDEESYGALGPLIWFLELFPGFASPKVLVMSLLALPVAVGINVLGVMVLVMGAAFAGFAICGFGLIVYWTAIVWMLSGYLCPPTEGMVEFDGRKWMVFMLLAMAPICAGFAYMGMS